MARSLDTKRQSNNKNTNEVELDKSIIEDEFGEKSIQENIELNQQILSNNEEEQQKANIKEIEEIKEPKLNKTDKSKKEDPKFHDKKCFRCGQRKILNGVCQNCGERYDNLK